MFKSYTQSSHQSATIHACAATWAGPSQAKIRNLVKFRVTLSNTYNVLLGLGAEGKFPVGVVVGAGGVFGVEAEAVLTLAIDRVR